MWSLTLKNVVANKARLVLTTLAVALGVSFVVSTFILSDTLQESFDGLAADVTEGIDLQVRPIEDFGSEGAITNETLDLVRGIPGVRAADGEIGVDQIQPVNAAGEAVGGQGIGLNWATDPTISGFTMADGQPPLAGQFVMTAATAEKYGFEIGETYEILTPAGTLTRELSGTADSAAGTNLGLEINFTLLPLADAQTSFGGNSTALEAIAVSLDDSASAATVQADIEAALGSSLEVVSQRTLQDEQAAQFNQIVSIFRNVLLGFAIIALFVSTFIIYNTFGIVLTQRIRELGLLRAIGAGEKQIRRSVIGEATVIGAIASVVGLIVGVGLFHGLRWIFDSAGGGLPAGDPIIGPRTLVLAFVIGIGVTVASAVGPARRAARISPVVAMNGTTDVATESRRRIIAGALTLLAGVLLGGVGLFAASEVATVVGSLGLALVAVFVGVTLLSPVITGPVLKIIGKPAQLAGGVSGTLAGDNARQNPRRTSTTAAALMIGLSLVTTVLVVGESVKDHVGTTLDRAVSADFVVSDDFDPISADLVAAVANIDEVDRLVTGTELPLMVADQIVEGETITMGNLADVFDLDVVEGSYAESGESSMVLSTDRAEDLGLSVGDSTTVGFDNGLEADFVVSAIYKDTTLFETGVMLDREAVEQVYPQRFVDFVATRVAPGVTTPDAAAALATLTDAFPQVTVETSTEYREGIEGQIDQILVIVNALLGLAIFIALIGIGLTLALSVSERTREIGLLRAIGMSRRQLRRMVRWEAALIALFGAVVGVVIGLVFGWSLVQALPAAVTSTVAIPGARLAVLVLISGLAGLLAALAPARRAARMNILDAVAS